MSRPITLKDAARFFLPLIFMTEMNMISKSIIHAFLARLAAPKVVLAGFSISFSFYYTLTSATEVFNLLAISYLRDLRSIRHLLGFYCLVLALPLLVVQLVAWTPLGDALYGGLFGASPHAIRQARLATFFLSLSAPVLMFRALAFAVLMLHRRTILITFSTLLRLLSLGVSLIVLPWLLEGAAAGAAALVFCMTVETAFAWAAGRRYFRTLPKGEGPQPHYGELWRFSWPLMLSQAAEMGIVMTINVFLGRFARPDLALAAFGVVQGLANVLLSPLRNLVQTAQTLTHTQEDVRVLLRFATWLVIGFTVLVGAVFLSPFRERILTVVMGLTPELSAYSEPGVMIAFTVAAGWGYAALFRGLLAGARRTGVLAFSAFARLTAVTLLGSLTLLFSGANGAVFGITAWAVTFAVEAGILGARLWQGGRSDKPIFPREETRET